MLYDAVRAIAASSPDATAVRTPGGEAVSYAEFCALVDRVAGGLREAGVGTGDVVACSLDNSIGYVALIVAAACLGATYVPMIREFSPDDVRAALELTQPAVAVSDGRRPALPGTVPVIRLAELLAAQPLAPRAGSSHWGRFRLLWTSGSTGFPKMMAWRQDKFLAERRRWVRHIGVTPADVVFCRHPLDVAHATDLHVFTALLAGAQLVIADPQASPDQHLRELASTGATVMSVLPRHYEQLIEAARAGGEASALSLRLPFCGGTYVSPQLIRDCDAVLGVRIRQLYGSTEFGLAAVNLADRVQVEADMPLVPGVSARLAGVPGQSQDIGELVLRSAYTSDGYLNNAAAHARTFRDGEYWTGDIAQRNADGSYRILGRADEAVAAAGGLLLTPALDEVIRHRCPVADVVSVPVTPGQYQSEVAVFAQPAPSVSQADAEAAIRSVLAEYGLTGPIHLMTALAYTAVGKPNKALLRARFIDSSGGLMADHEAGAAGLTRHKRASQVPALLLVPGLGMTSRYFDPVVADLGRDHDVVTVDLRGHGGAPEPPAGWTIDDAARDVRQVIEKLEMRDVTLVGWSIGAGVAYTYLDLFGTDRVKRLVSVEMSPRIRVEPDWPHAAFGGLDAEGAIGTQRTLWADTAGFVDGLVRGCFAAGSEPDGELLDELIAESQGCSATALLALWVDVLTRDWREQLATVTLPTLLVHGARSQIFPTDVGSWLRQAMPNARLEVFAHSGHLPFIEESEKFVAVLRDFMKETS